MLSNIERDKHLVQLGPEKLAALGLALGTDPDELVALAGKLPPDLAAALRDPAAMRAVRRCLARDHPAREAP